MDNKHKLKLKYTQVYSSLTSDYKKTTAELIITRQKINDYIITKRKIMNLKKKIKDLIQNQEAGSIAIKNHIGAITGQLAVIELKINRLKYKN
jgi:hypothetical protein